MTREEAVKLAKDWAFVMPHPYMGATAEECIESFMPHEWVIQAVLAAANQTDQCAKVTDSEKAVELSYPECRQPQIATPSGASCINGHGGLEGIEA